MAMTSKQKKAAACVIAAAIAAPAEGLRQHWYYCPAGIVSVCYGDTKNVDKTKTYSPEECLTRLNGEMLLAVKAVEACAGGELTINQTAAFADLVYNVGPAVVCDTAKSTLARKLMAGDAGGACNQIPRWDKARVAGITVALPGLTKRRGIERDLCLTPDLIQEALQ